MSWPDGRRWAYSITYDEGCRALLDHALPLHRSYGEPGHVALLAVHPPDGADLQGMKRGMGSLRSNE